MTGQTIEHEAVLDAPVATEAPPEGANLPAKANGQAHAIGIALQQTRDLSAALVQMLLNPDTDIERWKALEGYIERTQKRQAELSYHYARARMIPHMPVIGRGGQADVTYQKKNKPGEEGSFSYNYMLSDELIEKVQKVLGDFGFFWELKTTNDHAKKTVYCIGWLRHEDGHQGPISEVTLPYDLSGSKDEIKGYGSSESYAEKYILKALAVVAVKGHDKDGNLERGKPQNLKPQQAKAASNQTTEAPGFERPAYITEAQRKVLIDKLKAAQVDPLKMNEKFSIPDPSKFPADKYDAFIKWLDERIAKITGTASTAQQHVETKADNPAMQPKRSMVPAEEVDPHIDWENKVIAFLARPDLTKDMLMTFNTAECEPMDGVVPDDMWKRVSAAFGKRYAEVTQKDRRVAQR